MRTIGRLLIFTFPITFTAKILIGIYILFLVLLSINGNILELDTSVSSVISVVLGFLSLILFTRSIALAAYRVPTLLACSNIALIFFYLLFSITRLITGSGMDYAVLADNAIELKFIHTYQLVFRMLSPGAIIIFLLFLSGCIFIERRFKKFSEKPLHADAWWGLPSAAALFILLVISPLGAKDEFSSFFNSLYHYYRTASYDEFDPCLIEKDKTPYPYLRKCTVPVNPAPPTHVFIVMVESFNANYVRAKLHGKEYTPFFNSLIKKGIYYSNFYGNSVQTANGQFATLCSCLPLTRKRVFSAYPGNSFNCLPALLNSNGFETLFFQSAPHLEFDNAGVFLKKIGFRHVHAMDSHFISDEERKKYHWGSGIQDNIMFEKFFKYLDGCYGKAPGQKRFFAVLATISNHMEFGQVPVEQRHFYKKQETQSQKMANSIYISDTYLKTFFHELERREYCKNSLVIILGDHGFPAGEHGYYFPSIKFYRENFRTPLLLLWKEGFSHPREITGAYSQLDIAPTVMELLGISYTSHFQGASLLRRPQECVYCIQPYDGTYIGVIAYPYKYVYHKNTGKRYLFDLAKDPGEQHNIMGQKNLIPAAALHRKIGEVYFNDHIIRENRLYP